MNTQENNKSIAEFMGRRGRHRKDLFFFEDPHSNKFWHLEKDLKYHTSWDWLMPVVEKIESLPFEESNIYVDISGGTFIVTKEGDIEISEVFGGTKIENTYQAVIEFIKWYNNKKD